MPENDNPRQRLHNFLQSKGMANDLIWNVTHQGPSHNPVWYAICLVKGKELGNGRAFRKGIAKDEAARMALRALRSSQSPRVSMLTHRRRNSFP